MAVGVEHALIGEDAVRRDQILDQLSIDRAARDRSLGGREVNARQKCQQEDYGPAHEHVLPDFPVLDRA
jgi:hypothetical protein